ncbi:response regulator transcription factor [Eubacteriales bacterium OttesenSCG-928-A19]|nr:response regulator transcription factor [Eubacteriales bacterium OttesenSCG-928-A19]
MRLLVIEDEKDLLDALLRGFRKLQYTVDGAMDGLEGLALAQDRAYDLIVLDLNLPGMDGLEVLKNIREADRETKVLILSARAAFQERIRGLDMGADDYLVKPFDFGELDARVRNLLRRKFTTEAMVLSLGEVRLDTVQRAALTQEGFDLALSPKEYAILEYLVRHRGKPVPAEELIEHIWGEDALFSNTVKVHMSLLRRKLEPYAGKNAIQNIRGVGYWIGEDVS